MVGVEEGVKVDVGHAVTVGVGGKITCVAAAHAIDRTATGRTSRAGLTCGP
jgi:hypothetical protein